MPEFIRDFAWFQRNYPAGTQEQFDAMTDAAGRLSLATPPLSVGYWLDCLLACLLSFDTGSASIIDGEVRGG